MGTQCPEILHAQCLWSHVAFRLTGSQNLILMPRSCSFLSLTSPSLPPSTLRLHPSQQQEGLELQFCLSAKAHQHSLLQFGSIYDALTSAYSELNRKAAGKVGSVLPTPAEIFRALVRADKKQPILWVFKALLLKPSSKRKQLYNPLATERQEPFLSSPCTHLAPILPC